MDGTNFLLVLLDSKKPVGWMRKTSFLKQLYYCYLAKPAHDRALYRMAAQFEFNSIVEIGISSIERTCRVLEIAHRFSEQPIQYCGIDLFEANTHGQKHVGLKFAHVELKKTGANVKLMPGDPFSCLSRSANLLSGTDLLIIGAQNDEESMSRSWFYLPRMIHDESLVMIESTVDGQTHFDQCDFDSMMAKSEKSLEAYSRPTQRRAA